MWPFLQETCGAPDYTVHSTEPEFIKHSTSPTPDNFLTELWVFLGLTLVMRRAWSVRFTPGCSLLEGGHSLTLASNYLTECCLSINSNQKTLTILLSSCDVSVIFGEISFTEKVCKNCWCCHGLDLATETTLVLHLGPWKSLVQQQARPLNSCSWPLPVWKILLMDRHLFRFIKCY